MAVVYDSVNDNNPPLGLDDARLRVAWQDHLLGQVLPDMAADAALSVETQEDLLRSAYSPLLAAEKRQLAAQANEISLVEHALRADAGGRIAIQAGLLARAGGEGAVGGSETPGSGSGLLPATGDQPPPACGFYGCGFYDERYSEPTYQYWCLVWSADLTVTDPAALRRDVYTRTWTASGWFYQGNPPDAAYVRQMLGPYSDAAQAQAACGAAGGTDTVPSGGGEDDTEELPDDETDEEDDGGDDTDDDNGETEVCQPVRICDTVNVRIIEEEDEEDEVEEDVDEEEEDRDTQERGRERFPPLGGVTIPQALPPPYLDPGSPAVCVTASVLTAHFYKIGAKFHEWNEGSAVSPEEKIRQFKESLRGIPGFGQPLADLFGKAVPDLDKMAGEVIKQASGTFKGDEDKIQTGLHLARTIFRAMESVQVGFNFGLWLTATISLELRKIIQVIDLLIEYVSPVTPPDSGTLTSLILADEITPEHAACVTRLGGTSEAVLQKLVNARRSKPSEVDAVRDYFRFKRPLPELHGRLRRLGWTNADERELLVRNADFFPPPSDLIRFAVKDIWDKNKLGLAEMRRELLDQKDLLDVFSAIGIREVQYRGRDGALKPFDVPLAYWVASYEEVSPTQVYEMLHRLRPGRVGKWSLPGPGGQLTAPAPVLLDDVRKLLKEKDYNPIWRDRLAAISYRLPTRVDVRRIYKAGGFGPPRGVAGFDARDPANPVPLGMAERELVAVNQDNGYAETDARRLAYFTAKDVDDSRRNKQNTRHKSLLCRAFQSGAVTRERFLEQLEPMEPDRDERVRFVGLCDVERQVKRVEAAVKSIRSMFLRVVIDDAQATALLRQAGVQQERVNDYLSLWRLELAGRRKEVAASQLCAWRESGIVSDQEYVIRLLRLGYTRIDASNMLRHCHIGIAARSAKEVNRRLAAQQRLAEKAAKLADAAAREKARAADKAASRALTARTDANLRKWLDLGLIDDSDVLATLKLKGWSSADANRWLAAYHRGKVNAGDSQPTNGEA